MFGLFRKSQPHHPTPGLSQSLIRDGLPPGMEASSLLVVQKTGSYSGRRVSYFRVFDPVRVGECAVQVREFGDLDTHPDLVLGAGHIETDGAVVLSRRDRVNIRSTVVRHEADRSAHGDDEQFVFPSTDG